MPEITCTQYFKNLNQAMENESRRGREGVPEKYGPLHAPFNKNIFFIAQPFARLASSRFHTLKHVQ